jgi:gamma-glutamyltranspeptidase
MTKPRLLLTLGLAAALSIPAGAGSVPIRAKHGTSRPKAKSRRASAPTMWLKDGKYNAETHHNSYWAVGVPGTVAGLHLAWKEQGTLPWKRLVDPAVALARDGFVVSDNLARSLKSAQQTMQKYPARWRHSRRTGRPTSRARR